MGGKRQKRSRLKSIVYLLSINFILLAPMVFLTEFFLQRGIGLGRPIIYDRNILWGYSPAEHQSVQRRRNSRISINDVGVRATDQWSVRSGKRVVFFGDSVTYGGSYIDDNELFTSIACDEQNKFVCYNAGVNAQGILNMVARSRFDSRIKDSDVVIFTFITNDFFRGLRDHNTAHFMLKEPNKYFPALQEVLNLLATKYSLRNALSKCCATIQETDFERMSKFKALDWGLELLAQEKKRLANDGKIVFLAFSPERDRYLENSLDIYSGYLMESAEKFNLQIIDLAAPLRKSGHSIDELFYDHVHYEIGAHMTVGKYFNQLLRKQKLH